MGKHPYPSSSWRSCDLDKEKVQCWAPILLRVSKWLQSNNDEEMGFLCQDCSISRMQIVGCPRISTHSGLRPKSGQQGRSEEQVFPVAKGPCFPPLLQPCLNPSTSLEAAQHLPPLPKVRVRGTCPRSASSAPPTTSVQHLPPLRAYGLENAHLQETVRRLLLCS